ncbi:MAG: TRAP transporter substrate-binding protein DctP [Burkholderiaceae bacterium]|nr:TRAP transporter substrate-binding protein DctP [Burkholderiaceae bacterium]
MAAAAAAMVAGSAFAAEVDGPAVKWNMSTWGKKRAFTAGAERMAELVSQKTGGKFTVTIHYGGALSKSRENLDGLSVGAFEAAHMCAFYHPKKNPALMALTMPFLPMDSWENNRKMRDAVYTHPAIKKELAKWNAMAYMSTYLPQYEILGRGEPPMKLSDWKGKTIRAGGGLGDAMKIMGATPASSTATEVYTGVQQGTMDAASFPFSYAHVAYKIHEVTDWFTSNLSPGTSECPLLFSLSAYKKLPKQYQKLLDDIRDDVAKTQIQAYINIDKKNLPMLEKKLKKVVYTQAQLDEFRKVAGKPVIDQWIKEHQGKFDAAGLIKSMFAAVGQKYE